MSESLKPDAASLLASPEWHLFDFTVRERAFQFRAMDEKDYRESVFLDGRMENPRKQTFSLGFADTIKLFLRAGPPPATTSWIFHVGHCGSTLLSRALDFSAAVLPLREPKTLKFLADVRRELGQPVCLFDEQAFNHLRDVFIFALSRTFRPGQRPIVKATSTCNTLVLPLMEAAPGSQAILLYQPLEQYITGRFKSATGSLDLIAQARERMLDWLAIPGAPELHNSRLAPQQLAVLAWLTSMHYLLNAQRQQPERTRLLNFEDFLANPDQQLPAVADFLGLDVTAEVLGAHYERISVHYSKIPDKPYTADDRRRGLLAARQKQTERIARGMKWAEELVRAVPALESVGRYLR